MCVFRSHAGLAASVAAIALSALFGGGCAEDEPGSLLGDPGGGATTTPSNGADAGAAPDGAVDSATLVGDDGGPATFPFESIGPTSYVPKVKNLLVGLAPTDAEVQAVVKDPAALRGLIDQWMQLPEFKNKMLGFFRNAFQQNNVSLTLLQQSVDLDVDIVGDTARAQLERAMMDSFALTAWDIVSQGHPLTEAITTDRYMLNTPLIALLSYIDEIAVDDKENTTSRLTARKPIDHYTFDLGTTDLSATLDPSNGSYMLWRATTDRPSGCTDAPLTFNQVDDDFFDRLRMFIFGYGYGDGMLPCYPNGADIPSQFSDADWSDWRMVTIHPTDGTTPDTTPVFWDILKARAATEIWLHVPRIGFMGTPAFHANWLTNAGNSARVTANQSLIVAIGRSINGQGAPPAALGSIDAKHASNPACAGCHAQLDPYRQFFRQSYSVYYHEQTDSTQLGLPASFNIEAQGTGHGVGDVAKILASHPRLPLAWVQKLHYWANTLPALETDPEVLRIADAFQKSNYDFKTLVRELFSSPLVTFASATQTTTTQGVILSIARRDHFCAALSNRLGLKDLCAMTTAMPTDQQATLGERASLLPVDTYYRAAELPSLPTDPNLFLRAAYETVCQLIADQVVDAPVAPSRYDSTQPNAAIDDFVATVMALVPSDPRAGQAKDVLKDNFAQSTAGGASASDALKSTFTLACMAPTTVILGL